MVSDINIYKIAFASIRGMGYELSQKILEIIPSEKEYFDLSTKDLSSLLHIKNKIITSDYRCSLIEKAKKELEFIDKNKINVSYFSDDNFPQRLKDTPDAPIILYSKGNCDLNCSKIISIVGTRNSTLYGQHFCETLIHDIADNIDDVIIVSGLAYGIDIAAHRASLKHNIPTVAVLAHGLNTIYPAVHRNYAIDIIRHDGLLLTDYTSQDNINRANFLARNRIVAGLSDCTIVVESADKGGAITTAGIASSYNRDVFALPGRISDTYSVGCNRIIRNNTASMITNCDDLINAMRWESSCTKSEPKQLELFPDLSPEQKQIFELIKEKSEIHINVIHSTLNIPMPLLLSSLVDLEFSGLIISAPGNKYSIA